jgi:hypothetical protein
VNGYEERSEVVNQIMNELRVSNLRIVFIVLSALYMNASDGWITSEIVYKKAEGGP